MSELIVNTLIERATVTAERRGRAARLSSLARQKYRDKMEMCHTLVSQLVERAASTAERRTKAAEAKAEWHKLLDRHNWKEKVEMCHTLVNQLLERATTTAERRKKAAVTKAEWHNSYTTRKRPREVEEEEELNVKRSRKKEDQGSKKHASTENISEATILKSSNVTEKIKFFEIFQRPKFDYLSTSLKSKSCITGGENSKIKRKLKPKRKKLNTQATQPKINNYMFKLNSKIKFEDILSNQKSQGNTEMEEMGGEGDISVEAGPC